MNTVLEDELIKIFKNNNKYWGDTLNKTAIINDLKEYNSDLIYKLFDNKVIAENYVIDIKGVKIIKIDELISFLRYKKYWLDSFTKYTNKIGLSTENRLLEYNDDVVLDFPYKDCVLKGGMTIDEIGNDEIFYNNVIARDEIDTLLSPKIINNIYKYDATGKNKITQYDSNDNFVIKGNNLIVLSTLLERYKNKVDAIYIDPPYNTGNDANNTFKYNNNFNHSTWLTFMKNRLEYAKKLLNKETGVLMIAIDKNEFDYLGVLLDSIFGRNIYEKHIITVVHNPRGVQGKNFSYNNEFMYYIIPKNKKLINNRIIDDKEIEYSSLRNWGGESLRTDAKNCFYPIIINEKKEIIGFGEVTENTIHPEKNENIGEFCYIYPIDNKGIERKWRYARQTIEDVKHLLRVTEKEGIYDIEIGKNFAQYKTVWMDKKYDANEYGTKIVNKLVDKDCFSFPKSVYTVYDAIYSVVANKKDALVLDFFGGSGTTAQAVRMINDTDNGNRRYIIVEQMDYIKSVTVKRINELVNSGLTKSNITINKKGGSFVYFELMELNCTFINRILKASSNDQLQNIWKEIEINADLNYKVELAKLKRDVSCNNDCDDFNILTLDEQKNILIKSLDMNQLYISYSEIDDQNLNICEDIKEFNKSFYGDTNE